MTKIKKINQSVALLMIGATLLFTVSCNKVDHHLPSISPWLERPSGPSASQRFIIEMSTFGQTSCYGIIYDNTGIALHDISITHDGGATWHEKTITEMENNYLYGLAATYPNTVHVFGWNYVNGKGNIFRSTDGGISWQREGANAYAHPASFPDQMHFFTPEDGVIIGDPLNGYFEIWTTHNGGDLWSRIPSKNIPPPQPNEYPYQFISDTHGNSVWSIFATVDSNFFPVGARLMQSDDKGETWYVRNSSMTLVGGDGSLKFRNHSVGLFKNNGILYRTTDGGTTWKVVNYSGKWFSFDHDNVPGKPGWWISTGGGTEGNTNSLFGFGSSISYDDGDHWITLDTDVNHTCVDMTSPTHGYSGGFTTGSGNDGVFVYKFPPAH